jgi:hypothetical protein
MRPDDREAMPYRMTLCSVPILHFLILLSYFVYRLLVSCFSVAVVAVVAVVLLLLLLFIFVVLSAAA